MVLQVLQCVCRRCQSGDYHVVVVDYPAATVPRAVYLSAHFDVVAAEKASRCFEAACRIVVACRDYGRHGRTCFVGLDQKMIIRCLGSCRRVAVVEYVSGNKKSVGLLLSNLSQQPRQKCRCSGSRSLPWKRLPRCQSPVHISFIRSRNNVLRELPLGRGL